MWRWVKVPNALALIAFALPWLTVSCSTTVLVRASGWALATGRVTVLNPITGAAEATPVAHPNFWLLAAFILVAAGLVASLLPRRRGASIVTVGSVIALLLVVVAAQRIGSEVRSDELQRRAGRTVVPAIDVAWQVGFWLEIVSLLAVAGMAGTVATGRDQAPTRALDMDDSTGLR